MSDDEIDDAEWLKNNGFYLLPRSPDREARYAEGVDADLWNYLHAPRLRAMRGKGDLEEAYKANHTIRRLKKIAARTGMTVYSPKLGRSRFWSEEQREAARQRALATGLGRKPTPE